LIFLKLGINIPCKSENLINLIVLYGMVCGVAWRNITIGTVRVSSGVLARKLAFGYILENILEPAIPWEFNRRFPDGAKIHCYSTFRVLQNIRETSRVFGSVRVQEWLENSGRKVLSFLKEGYVI